MPLFMRTWGYAMWFWIWRALLLVLITTVVVLLGRWLGSFWAWLLPVVFSTVVGPPLIERWRRLGQTHRGTRGSGQDVTD